MRRVSIVIPVWNRVDLTAACLVAVAENTPEDLFEVVIVDNGSTDDTPVLLEGLEGDVVVIRNDTNLGFGVACNQGAEAASGEVLVFLNNDTEVQPGWLPPLLEALDEDSCRGAVQPLLLRPDGLVQDAGGLVFRGGDAWIYGRGLPVDDPRVMVRRSPDYVSGACLAIRRTAFDAVGGFDLRYSPAYYEDTDLGLGLVEAGWTLLVEPRSRVLHLEGGTAGKDLSQGLKAYQVRNKQLFAEKWASRLRDRPAMNPGVVERWANRRAHVTNGLPLPEVRRSILVLDPFPPMVDRASGSLRMFQVVRCLVSAGHHVVYYAVGTLPERERYQALLGKLGVQLLGRAPGQESPTSSGGGRTAPSLQEIVAEHGIDTVWMTPWTTAASLMTVVRSALPAALVIVDSCDLAYRRERRDFELGVSPWTEVQLAERAESELEAYRSADVVVCVSEQEAADLTSRLQQVDVVVVGNAHDPHRRCLGREGRSGLLFVGNANHPPNVDAVRWWVEEIAPRLREALPGVRLQVIGNDPAGRLAQAAAGCRDIEVVGWVPDVAPYLEEVAISVAPLRSGAGVKGKIGEALAAGVPVVTTPVGAEGMELTPGTDVLVGADPREFVEQLVLLYQDRDAWERLSSAGPKWAATRMGLTRMAAAVARVLGDVTGSVKVPPTWTAPTADVEPPRAGTPVGVTTSAAAPELQAGSRSRAAGGRMCEISVVLNVKNEERRLETAVRSVLSWTDEVVVADMASSDRTVEIARSLGCRVIQVPDTGYVEPAREAAVDAARGPWVVLLDADEVIPPSLARRIVETVAEDRADVLRISRLNYFMGEPLRHTGWGLGVERHLRVFKKGSLTFSNQIHVPPAAAPSARVAELPADDEHAIVHFNYEDFSHFLAKLDRYTDIEADHMICSGRRLSGSEALGWALEEFEERYRAQCGELDGYRGMALAWLMGTYRMVTWAKVEQHFAIGDLERIRQSYAEAAERILASSAI